jgi:hypothetical protein
MVVRLGFGQEARPRAFQMAMTGGTPRGVVIGGCRVGSGCERQTRTRDSR